MANRGQSHDNTLDWPIYPINVLIMPGDYQYPTRSLKLTQFWKSRSPIKSNTTLAGQSNKFKSLLKINLMSRVVIEQA